MCSSSSWLRPLIVDQESVGSNPIEHLLQAPLVGIGRHVQLKPELAERLEVRDFYGA